MIKCAICNNDKAVAVCHHCGTPLCKDKRCRFPIKDDPVFSTKIVAFHCRGCLQIHHATAAEESW